MAAALLYVVLAVTTIYGLMQSWVAVLAYYTLALWSPMTAWPWVFTNVRASFIVAATTVIRFLLDLFQGKLDFSVLKQRQNIYMAILWLSLILSYFLGAYPPTVTYGLMMNSEAILGFLNKIFFFYFISVILIDTRKKQHYMIIMLMAVVVYFIYWANHQYLIAGFYKSRLAGPGPLSGSQGGPYSDENCFAMVFVMGIPFLYYMGRYYKNKVVKLCLWGAIPFAWHSIFLTGSAGGMIGLGITTGFMIYETKKKIVKVGLPALLVAAFLWQGGEYLQMKLLDTGGDITTVETAQTRFQSWQAGTLMVLTYPLNGVGIGNFLKAYPDFSETQPFVAHNTVIQFAAESGVVAGMMYILLFLNIVSMYRRQRYVEYSEDNDLANTTRKSIFVSALGFYVCSMFLNLATYETFYFLLILSSVQERLFLASSFDQERQIPSKA